KRTCPRHGPLHERGSAAPQRCLLALLDAFRDDVACSADAEQAEHLVGNIDELPRLERQREIEAGDHEREQQELKSRHAGLWRCGWWRRCVGYRRRLRTWDFSEQAGKIDIPAP